MLCPEIVTPGVQPDGRVSPPSLDLQRRRPGANARICKDRSGPGTFRVPGERGRRTSVVLDGAQRAQELVKLRA